MGEYFPSILREVDDQLLEFTPDFTGHPLLNEKPLPLITNADQERAKDFSSASVDLTELPVGENWAWLGAPRWIDSRRAAIKGTTGKFACLDACSAVPLYATMTEGRHFKRCYDKACGIIGQLTEFVEHRRNAPLNELLSRQAFGDNLPPAYLLNRIFEHTDLSRAISSSLHAVLYVFDADEALFGARTIRGAK
jgi:hypothetical protein